MRFLWRDFEIDGEALDAADRVALMMGGFPAGHGHNETHGLTVETWRDGMHDAGRRHGAIGLDDELHHNPTLYAQGSVEPGITDIGAEKTVN